MNHKKILDFFQGSTADVNNSSALVRHSHRGGSRSSSTAMHTLVLRARAPYPSSPVAIFERSLLFFICLCAFASLLRGAALVAADASATTTMLPPSSLASAAAKRNALDLAEALLNEGFRVRDGSWSLSLKPKEARFLQVTLFSGNQYWFIAAASPPAATLQVTLYDVTGHPLKLDHWKDDLSVPGARAGGGILAPHSGKYFVKLEMPKSLGAAPADACLVYAYK